MLWGPGSHSQLWMSGNNPDSRMRLLSDSDCLRLEIWSRTEGPPVVRGSRFSYKCFKLLDSKGLMLAMQSLWSWGNESRKSHWIKNRKVFSHGKSNLEHLTGQTAASGTLCTVHDFRSKTIVFADLETSHIWHNTDWTFHWLHQNVFHMKTLYVTSWQVWAVGETSMVKLQ